jgi:DNA-binding HxlR family transcriptional regulator
VPRIGKKAVGCPVEITLKVISGRWKVLVLHHLLAGTMRFSALYEQLEGISHRTLTKQLRELEGDGVLRRYVYREVPPKVEYSLTALGKSLEPVLLSMHAWGETFSEHAGTARTSALRRK